MQWKWIILGFLLLIAAWSITCLLRSRKQRLRLPHALLRLLKKAARLQSTTPDIEALHANIRPLMEYLLHVQRYLANAPSLPVHNDNESPLITLAYDVADEGLFTIDAILHALSALEAGATPSEVLLFPLCVAVAQSQRLRRVLLAILADARERATAAKLLRRMMRSRQPAALLAKSAVSSIALAELIRLAHLNDPERVLPITETWLVENSLSSDGLTQRILTRQIQLAEELHRAVSCFSAIQRMDWSSRCAEADALHIRLLDDPAGLYARMDASSQLLLRRQIENLSRRTHLEAADLLQQALFLADASEETSLEHSVCFWFQDAQGLLRLHRSLPTRKGWLYVRFILRQERNMHVFLWIFSLVSGFLFLQNHGPVFMLPVWAFTTGCISRCIVQRFSRQELPRLSSAGVNAPVRTLVVLPAVLSDPHEAIRMVRQLKTAMHAFPSEADFLLLGDFAPSITPVSSGDQAIIHAAASAVAAMENQRVMYLHRARAWDSAQHCYASRGGGLTGITEVCRLIAQGECEDVISFSTVEAAQFERQYAYVMALPANCQPSPGMYDALMRTITHPLNERYPTTRGWRGYAVLSPQGHTVFHGVGLIRPDAFLEATDGRIFPQRDAAVICGELAGQASVPQANVRTVMPVQSWSAHYERIRKTWRTFPWQFPLVQTPSGLVNNPLSSRGRFRLREQLRATLVPLSQCLLLLFSLLTQNWLLLFLSLLPSFLDHPPRNLGDAVRLLCRLSLLPTEAVIPVRGILDLLRRKTAPTSSWTAMEVWVQGLASTLMTALGIVLPSIAVPALGLGVLFACFPLAHRCLNAPSAPVKGLSRGQLLLLERVAASTWQYFLHCMERSPDNLPQVETQFEPAVNSEFVTSPHAIGAEILACICARDLGFLKTDSAAERLARLADTLTALPMPLGLPCRQYALPSLTILDAHVDARACGFLLCALMTSAQALRSWLAELPPEQLQLSAQFEKLIASFDVKQLYNSESGLFYEGLDEDAQPVGFADYFSDETLLLSIAACANQLIPPEHFSHLKKTKIRFHRKQLQLSPHGTAAENLLASLFVPTNPVDVLPFIHAMGKAGQNGLFGQDKCAHFDFDPSLRYRKSVFGLREASVRPCHTAPVYTPWAAALCLLHQPWQGAHALEHFTELGALGPEGFCDAVDLTQGTALVGLQDTYHQSIILAAAAHLLADAPIQRYFCSLPQVEAILPLLELTPLPVVLPALPIREPAPVPDIDDDRTADPTISPPDAHVLGNADFHLIADAAGNSLLYDRDISLTRFAQAKPYGLQFYIADEGRVYRLNDVSLRGTASFSSGAIRYEQLCGSLRAEIVCTVDTLRKQAIHILTITNLSTRDRLIDLADLLIPDLAAAIGTLEVTHPEKHLLTAHARGTNMILHHTLSTVTPPLSINVCTDLNNFLGRRQTLHSPSSLEAPASDQATLSADPCLSFRIRLALGGRGQACAWFTTCLQDNEAPSLSRLNSIRRLATLQHKSIERSIPLTAEQACLVQRFITPAVLAGYRVLLQLEEAAYPSLLEDLAAILRRLHLHGTNVDLFVSCPDELHKTVNHHLHEFAHFCSPEDCPPCTLVFRGDLPLDLQLDALRVTLPAPASSLKHPLPVPLEKSRLLHSCTYGGFEPETKDYIIRLVPGQTTPTAWENHHTSRYFSETVDESGLRAPFDEKLQIRMHDGTILTPFAKELFRTVRVGLNETTWEASSTMLDVRLTAACLPGQRCGFRVLRIRNTSDQELLLQIAVLANLSSHVPLECGPGTVMSAASASMLHAFLAGNGWDACRVVVDHPENSDFSCLPDNNRGRFALLRCEICISPRASKKAVWLAGFARHSEDIARALTAVQTQSASGLLRDIRFGWAEKLGSLTISTPEDTLDLLMNRILPAQALSADDSTNVLAAIYLAPQNAKRTLLQSARRATTCEDFARLALLTATYIRVTGDEAILDVRITSRDADLFSCCSQAIQSLPLKQDGLPEEEQQRHVFLYGHSAQVLHEIRPNAVLLDWSRKLLHAADTHLWQECCYGSPLKLEMQHESVLALGSTPHTRLAVQTCWRILYDRPHGLIRSQEPADLPPLPGMPENGGMRTFDAVLFLHALLLTGHREEAFELLRALNPIHHADNTERQETFCGAPYRLHGGMLASPLEAGHSVSSGGNEAAAALFIVVLHDILGFRRAGNRISFTPCVPDDWDEYTLTLQEGASTWHISLERRINTLTIDGCESNEDYFTIQDDGNIHHIRFPLA